MSAAARALHNFLPDVTAFVKTKRVEQAGLKRYGVLAHIGAVAGDSGLNPQRFQSLRTARSRAARGGCSANRIPDSRNCIRFSPNLKPFFASARGPNYPDWAAGVGAFHVIEFPRRRRTGGEESFQELA